MDGFPATRACLSVCLIVDGMRPARGNPKEMRRHTRCATFAPLSSGIVVGVLGEGIDVPWAPFERSWSTRFGPHVMWQYANTDNLMRHRTAPRKRPTRFITCGSGRTHLCCPYAVCRFVALSFAWNEKVGPHPTGTIHASRGCHNSLDKSCGSKLLAQVSSVERDDLLVARRVKKQ